MERREKEELTESEQMLIGDIRNGSLENWYAVELKASVLGYEITSKFVYLVLKMSNDMRFYTILKNTLMTDNVLDGYFEDHSIITKMIEKSGEYCFEVDLKTNGTNKMGKVETIEILKELDMRNPRYLLKYFLYDTSTYNNEKYYKLFLDIIERSKIRASKMKVFEGYAERLEEKYKEKRFLGMIMT